MIRHLLVAATLSFFLTSGSGSAAQASHEPITYLLPAPETAVVFAPFLLAQREGRYAAQGLDVRFRVVPGGLHVGEALGRGEGDLGGAIGDTPILLRAEGTKVQGVALLGHHSFVTLMTRPDLKPGLDLSAAFGVPSLRDTTHYALESWIRSLQIDPIRVPVRTLQTDALIDGVVQGRMAGMVGTVDWGVRAERQGMTIAYRSLDDVYPAMAQAVMASETMIRDHPSAVRAFVRVTLASIRSIEHDPAAAADAWCAIVPDSGYSREEVTRIFTLLSEYVYGDSPGLGRFDRRTMERALEAAKAEGLIPAPSTAKNSFTNRFVGRSNDQIRK